MTDFGNLEAIVRGRAQLEAAYGEEGPWVRSLPSNGLLRPLHLDPLQLVRRRRISGRDRVAPVGSPRARPA